MAQLTVYIDDETRKKIEVAAARAKTSVSAWVKQRLSRALETDWPEGYFEVLGCLKDVSLERPPEPSTEADSTREPL